MKLYCRFTVYVKVLASCIFLKRKLLAEKVGFTKSSLWTKQLPFLKNHIGHILVNSNHSAIMASINQQCLLTAVYFFLVISEEQASDSEQPWCYCAVW